MIPETNDKLLELPHDDHFSKIQENVRKVVNFTLKGL